MATALDLQKTKKHRNQRRVSANIQPVQEVPKGKYAATIAVLPEVAYTFFRNFQNLPYFMKDLKTVEVVSEKRSHWVIEVKGMKAEWDAEIVEERPGEFISWRSVKGSDVQTNGTIWFTWAHEGLGTIVHLNLNYKVPGGKLTELLTKMSGEDPDSLALINLRRFKCFLETGEIATIEGQSSGRDDDSETLKHEETFQ